MFKTILIEDEFDMIPEQIRIDGFKKYYNQDKPICSLKNKDLVNHRKKLKISITKLGLMFKINCNDIHRTENANVEFISPALWLRMYLIYGDKLKAVEYGYSNITQYQQKYKKIKDELDIIKNEITLDKIKALIIKYELLDNIQLEKIITYISDCQILNKREILKKYGSTYKYEKRKKK